MRFRVGREALGEAVAWVARALPSRPVVPVLSGLLLEAGDDGLILSCFDYEVSARVRIEADVNEPGTALVPGRLLAEITRSLPALDVEVASDADLVREEISVATGAAKAGLQAVTLSTVYRTSGDHTLGEISHDYVSPVALEISVLAKTYSTDARIQITEKVGYRPLPS